MPTKRYSTEQIVSKLRQAEEELSRGLRTPAMCKKRGISEQTYYRWRTKRSTIRFSKRWPRETSEPAETPAGGGLGPPPAGRVGAAGSLGHAECWARRGRPTGIGRGGRMMSPTVGGPDHRVGDAVWAVGLSADYGAVAWGGLAGESQARGAAVAAGRVESPPEAAPTRAVVAHRRVVQSSMARLSPPRVGVCLSHGTDA